MATRLEKSARHRQILDRSLQTFLENGYEATSTRELAAAAGMSKANLYHHFSSKDDILRELLAPLFAAVEELIATNGRTGAAKSPREVLKEYVEIMLHHRKTLTLLTMNVSIHSKPDLHDKTERLEQCTRELLAGPGADAESLVRAECALGAIRAAVTTLGHEQERAVRTAGLEAALRALGEA